MSEWRIRRRTRLKRREALALRDQIMAALGGLALWGEEAAVERGSLPDFDAVVVDGVLVALVKEGIPFLTVRGLLLYRPSHRFVTVDMGAVPYVTKGADVMAPGIVDADPALQEGDWCWVRDERNQQPLAVGRALVPGGSMAAAGKGRAVAVVHHIGDRLWTLQD